MPEYEFRLPKFLATQQTFREKIEKGHPDGYNRIQLAAYMGGWGSGKTTIGKWTVFDAATCFPGLKILVCRKTFAALNITSKQELIERMTEASEDGHNIAADFQAKFSETEQLYTHVSGSTIRFGGLDKTQKWGSTEFGMIWYDEASESDEGDLEFLLGRLRQNAPPCPGCKTIGCEDCGYTGNAWGPDYRRVLMLTANHVHTIHHLYERLVGDRESPPAPGVSLVETSSYENDPKNGGHLPPGYLESLTQGLSKESVSVNVDGDWGAVPDGTPVYKVHTHLNGKPWHKRSCVFDPSRPLYPCWDFGYRFPFVTFHQMQARGRWRILAEFSLRDSHTEACARAAISFQQELFPGAEIPYVYGDPAGRAMRSEGESDKNRIEKVYGRAFRSVPSTKQSKRARRERIVEMLEQTGGDEPMFAYDGRRCPILSQAMQGMYRYPKIKSAFSKTNFEEQPVEEHPFVDVVHSVEYFAANHFRLVDAERRKAAASLARQARYQMR